MSNLIGQTLGPYRIIEQIGIGGMATVYKAYQPSMDRYVAIKVLPVLVSRDPAFLKRFRREAKVVAKLEHKHILPVHDYGEQEGLTYLVMRYVEAGTLKDRLAAGQLDLPSIYRIIAQIGSALDYAHRLGVIHRDVKPSNVLIDSQGDAYLTDFGLARIMESSEQLTATGVGVGTPDYMAPEQGQGLKIDHRSDIYSLGVILYEMVTGQVPYQAETPIAVVMKHITAPLPLPSSVKPGVPQQVERVILKALAKKPEDRFQTAREMAEALDLAVRAATAAQVEREVLVPVSVAPAKLRWPWDVRTTALGVGIAALALLVIGGMFFALSHIQYRVQVVGGRVEVVPISTEAVTPTPAVALAETPTGEAALGTPTPTRTPTVTPTMTTTPVPTTTPTLTETPEPADTPVPTATPTATPTRTPLPTPTPNATIDTDPTVYDNFNNPAFDGEWNTGLWTYGDKCNPANTFVKQKDGILMISRQFDHPCGLEALRPRTWTIDQIGFVEAKLMLDGNIEASEWGDVGIVVTGLVNGDEWWTACYILGKQQEGDAWAACSTSDYGGHGLAVQYNSWHTMRLEINPDTATISYFVDGQQIDGYVHADPEAFTKTQFKVGVYVWSFRRGLVTGYIDDVRIGQTGQ